MGISLFNEFVLSYKCYHLFGFLKMLYIFVGSLFITAYLRHMSVVIFIGPKTLLSDSKVCLDRFPQGDHISEKLKLSFP